MLSWFTSFWTDELSSGPARNAPNNGFNIKEIFDQRPKQVITLSAEEVQEKLRSLKPTVINANPPVSNKPPLMKEFDDVFTSGYKEFLEAQRKKRSEKMQQHISVITLVHNVDNENNVENVFVSAHTAPIPDEHSLDISDLTITQNDEIIPPMNPSLDENSSETDWANMSFNSSSSEQDWTDMSFNDSSDNDWEDDMSSSDE